VVIVVHDRYAVIDDVMARIVDEQELGLPAEEAAVEHTPRRCPTGRTPADVRRPPAARNAGDVNEHMGPLVPRVEPHGL
jgi:hypothetical protein